MSEPTVTTPETPVTPPPAPAPAKPTPGEANREGALEVLRAMKAAGLEPKPAPVEPPAPVPPPVEPPPVADPPKPADDSFARLTAAEAKARDAADRLRAAEERIKAAEAQATKLAELESLFAAAERGDAAPLFKRVKWTPETVAKYAEGGAEAIKPDVVSNEVAALREELNKEKAAREAREYQQTIVAHKSWIQQEIVKEAPSFPLATQYFTNPDTGVLDAQAAADQIFAIQAQAYQTEQRQVSFAEAAQSLEASLEALSRRFGVSGKPKPPAVPVVTKTTPSAPVAPPKVVPPTEDEADPPGMDPDRARALRAIRRLQAAGQ